MLHDFIIDIFSAIVNIFLGSFLFPLKGWGDRYGESVSKITQALSLCLSKLYLD